MLWLQAHSTTPGFFRVWFFWFVSFHIDLLGSYPQETCCDIWCQSSIIPLQIICPISQLLHFLFYTYLTRLEKALVQIIQGLTLWLGLFCYLTSVLYTYSFSSLYFISGYWWGCGGKCQKLCSTCCTRIFLPQWMKSFLTPLTKQTNQKQNKDEVLDFCLWWQIIVCGVHNLMYETYLNKNEGPGKMFTALIVGKQWSASGFS